MCEGKTLCGENAKAGCDMTGARDFGICEKEVPLKLFHILALSIAEPRMARRLSKTPVGSTTEL